MGEIDAYFNRRKFKNSRICINIINNIINLIKVNGIRLIDKSQIGKKTLFRMEIWIRKGYDLSEMENLKIHLKDLFGSLVNESKIIV